MNQLMERIIKELESEMDNALDVGQRNRAAGSPAESVAYDSGRYTGLKDALEVVLRHAETQR